MIETIILISLFVLSVILAGLFAGSETGMYQLSRLRLRFGVEQKRFSFLVLSKVLRNSNALLLTILLSTNLLYYGATSIVTFMLLRSFGSEHTVEIFTTLITVPILFVFSELIPKNIFFYRADSLMPYVSGVLFVFHKVLTWCGVIMVLEAFSNWFAKLTGSASLSRVAIKSTRQPYIKAIYEETREEGFLSQTQMGILNRLEGISHLSVKSVMTSLGNAQMVSRNIGRLELLKKLESCVYTRLLVYYLSPSNVVGFVDIYQSLAAAQEFSSLSQFISPIRKIASDTSVTDAINIMQDEGQKIVLVTRKGHHGRERPIGIITMKDLAEELLGELVEW
ncbi:MAG: DUF21 domain-containing protein [Planctomycetes bacterium]|nr:DUF21 domain-containing protein [Planctomycetota bacterium]